MVVSRTFIILPHLMCTIYLVAAVNDHQRENPFTAVVRKTLIATARSCMDHVNATQTDLEHLREDPPFPEKSACIIECLLEKIGIVSNNRYSKSGFMTAITPLVFTNKKKLEHMKTVAENCDKEACRKRLISVDEPKQHVCLDRTGTLCLPHERFSMFISTVLPVFWTKVKNMIHCT